jgi:hypothetical protein
MKQCKYLDREVDWLECIHCLFSQDIKGNTNLYRVKCNYKNRRKLLNEKSY